MASQSAPVTLSSDPNEPTQLRRVLGVPGLVLFGLVYMVPLTVFTTYGIITQVTGGRLPLAYLITLCVMMFTARSYGLMSRALPYAGSAYTYTQRTFGSATGLMVGWALMLDYLFLPMLNYLVAGIYLHAAFPVIPSWVFIVATIAIVTTLNVVGIVSVTRANLVIISLQAVFIVVFIALSIAALYGNATLSLTQPFTGDGTAEGFAPLMSGAAILCLSFLGFDSVSTLAEETKNPRRSLPVAITIVTLGAGLLFILLAYLAHAVFPSNAFTDVDSAALDVMRAVGGQFFTALFSAAFIAGGIGAAIAAQASAARILFAMGRDGVLPKKFFGRLNARFQTPAFATLTVAAVALGAVFVDLQLISSTVSFGALAAFSAVNLAVIKHYFFGRKDRTVSAVLRFLVFPLIGLGLTIWLWTSLSVTALTIGFIWLGIGFVWLLVITRGFRRPTPSLHMTA
ncbi:MULTISPECIES: APC family permease [unclassified Mycolicibacterium]|uniref:APC family permease n=1 Tax=unclassified Mycolicibacterium TaxID=2636767 RepID=UPI0012DF71AC|nr:MULTISPECIES: amino acid permease [unclassified Mycolicibacterium]MUL83013.1 amino acid permease [Mycolicibacterium sp. CBMA 329]MUL89348.1 amino acid permease [Mycolicibacterium sp. CBMA 331]MUL99037.1 amino acid permease [Mycolicibacterium sp. CBMA 334]MUM25666.1 amino acid permease [Mycolicibacterium sp. CBMA 295]MUM38864.1 amino acid permease [Mycolicibacterium sp. CBMA 247]